MRTGDIILTEVNHLPTGSMGVNNTLIYGMGWRVERKKKETVRAAPVWALGQGKWMWWQLVMKQADMQESWSPSLEYITRLCMHHLSAHMWPALRVCVHAC